MAKATDPIVGQKEIAEALRVPPNTVYQWAKRDQLPEPEGMVGGAPAWHWSTIRAWAQRTGRMPGLREAILDLLLQAGAGTTTSLAQRLIAQGFARSVSQVWRAINDLHYEGFIGIRLGNEWFLTDQGKALAEQRRRGPRLSNDNAHIRAVYVPSVLAKLKGA
jgi:predicted DNA-binding transcriptional regulator AlpA